MRKGGAVGGGPRVQQRSCGALRTAQRGNRGSEHGGRRTSAVPAERSCDLPIRAGLAGGALRKCCVRRAGGPRLHGPMWRNGAEGGPRGALGPRAL